MKEHILKAFYNMPRPLAFIIHYEAREMLDDWWRSGDDRSRGLCKAKLFHMMELIYRDAERTISGPGTMPMPMLTLEYIKGMRTPDQRPTGADQKYLP
jgi:hypothetical protein